MNDIDYKAVVQILEDFLKQEKVEILGISVGQERQVRLAIENLIQENKELEKENFNLKEKQIIDKCEVPTQDNFYDYYAQNYLQIPVSFLTEENLDWLEQHCEKAIRYATRNKLKEHQITLELIVEYKEMNKEIRELEEKLQQYKKIEEIVNTITDDDIRNAIKNAEKDYIPKSKVKEKIELLEKHKQNIKQNTLDTAYKIAYCNGGIDSLNEIL